MKSSSALPRFTSVVTLLLLSGCNSAYREAFARAKDAAVRGDFLNAARSYRDACRASPDDQEACGRVPLFSVKAMDQAISTARPACDAGDLDKCLPPLLDARDLLPEHGEMNTMFASASQVQTERCETQWKEDGSVGTAVAGFACLQARAHQLPVGAYQDLLASRASQLSSRFVTLATTAGSQGSDGAATALWTAAQCLAPSELTNSQIQRSREGFLAQSSIPVDARLGGNINPAIGRGLADPCESLASGLPYGTRCAAGNGSRGQPEPLFLEVDALIQRVAETVSEQVNRVNYVSGTRQVPNPDFERARDRLGHAERALRQTEKALANAEKECKKTKPHDATCVGCDASAAPSTPACDEARKLDEERQTQVAARAEAGRAMDGLPETLSEEVHEDFTYSVLTHHWVSPFQFTLRASTPGSGQPVRDAGELVFADAEHVGFQPAGLTADPLVVPPPHAFANAFLDKLAPHLFAAVQREGQVRGAARRAACSSLPADWSTAWVQCWSEANLWERGAEPAPNEFLRVLATSRGASEQPQCR